LSHRYPNIRITADRLLVLLAAVMAVFLVFDHGWKPLCFVLLVTLGSRLHSRIKRDRPNGRSASTLNP
jgi:hypothetical protein